MAAGCDRDLSGTWDLVAARPGFVFCPPRYCWTPGGCVFTEGYWDYDLADRGVLCAPVSFTRFL